MPRSPQEGHCHPTSSNPTPTWTASGRSCGAAYACLTAMRDRTAAAVAVADNAAQEVDAAIAKAHLSHRLRSLSPDVPGLSFGRLDDEDGDTWYVGRRHVEDDRGDPVVVDWRAPVSTPFYRATAADPLGLAPAAAVPDDRHRAATTSSTRSSTTPTRCTPPTPTGGIPDPLLAELERSRTGAMRDIVATIAAEQDVVIRAPLDTCLVVQGGPGTGKTAVGLHRAAFLLYEHRELLDRDGVLVVGPNPRVPPLHRAGAPVAGRGGHPPDHRRAARRRLGPAGAGGRRTRAGAAPRATPAWRRCWSPALRGDAPPPDRGRGRRHRLGPADPHRRRPSARPSTRSSSGACPSRPVAPRCGPGCTGSRGSSTTRPGATARRRPTCSTARSAAAPTSRPRSPASGRRPAAPPSPSGCSPARRALAAAADGLLDAGRAARCSCGAAARKLDDEPWTVAELVLVDEAEALVSGPPTTYGHLVVDEAQDLSAMELRAAGPALPEPVDDRPRRPRPGHRARRHRLVGRRRSATSARRRPRASRSSSSATGCPRRSSRWPTACSPAWRRRCGRPGRCGRPATSPPGSPPITSGSARPWRRRSDRWRPAGARSA